MLMIHSNIYQEFSFLHPYSQRVSSCQQVVVAVLLVLAVYKPLPKWSPIAGWELKIDWRLPSFKSTKRFLIFAGPICFVLLTKVLMYSESYLSPSKSQFSPTNLDCCNGLCTFTAQCGLTSYSNSLVQCTRIHPQPACPESLFPRLCPHASLECQLPPCSSCYNAVHSPAFASGTL